MSDHNDNQTKYQRELNKSDLKLSGLHQLFREMARSIADGEASLCWRVTHDQLSRYLLKYSEIVYPFGDSRKSYHLKYDELVPGVWHICLAKNFK